MNDKEKQSLVLKLKQITGFTVRKCTSLLQENDWDLDKANPNKVVDLFEDSPSPEPKPVKEPKKKKPRQSKTKQSKNSKIDKGDTVNVEPESEQPKTKVNDYNDFDWYIQRCKEQSEDKTKVKNINIGTGFYTMYEIIAYTKSQGYKIKNNKPATT